MSLPVPHKYAAGCVVYRAGADGLPLILLILDKYGRWTLPKGHLEAGESEEQAAIREVAEETGIAGRLGALIGRIRYDVRTKKGALRHKQVAFFLMQAASAAAQPQAEEGIGAAEWYAPQQALARIGYPQVRAILAQALDAIAQLPSLS